MKEGASSVESPIISSDGVQYRRSITSRFAGCCFTFRAFEKIEA